MYAVTSRSIAMVSRSRQPLALEEPTYSYLNRSELDIEMVRVSLSIPVDQNKDASLLGRKFALRSLGEYAGVTFRRTNAKTARAMAPSRKLGASCRMECLEQRRGLITGDASNDRQEDIGV